MFKKVPAKALFVIFFLSSCKTTIQNSQPETITSVNNGRAFGFIQHGTSLRLTECLSLDDFNAAKAQEFSAGDCIDYVIGITAEEKAKVEESLRREILQLRKEPSLSRFVGQVFPDSEAPLEFLTRALQEIEDPSQQNEVNSYIFRNVVKIVVEEFNLLRDNGAVPINIFTIPKFFYQAGLISMLSTRCSHYKIANKDCPHIARDFITALDFTVASPSGALTLISFPKLTQAILREPSTTQLLSTLEKDLSNQENSLYLRLLETLGADKALEIMATIFQDTAKAHLGYLYLFTETQDLGHALSQNIEKTEQLINKITVNPRLAALPGIDDPEPQGDRSYHIFVPALAAKKVLRNGRSPETVAQLTFIFNTLYEYAQEVNQNEKAIFFAEIANLSNGSDSNLSVMNNLNQKIDTFFAIFKDPESLAAIDAGTKEDFYYGYVAALWGTGQPISKIMKYEEFARRFFLQPYEFIANTENFRAR